TRRADRARSVPPHRHRVAGRTGTTADLPRRAADRSGRPPERRPRPPLLTTRPIGHPAIGHHDPRSRPGQRRPPRNSLTPAPPRARSTASELGPTGSTTNQEAHGAAPARGCARRDLAG